MIDGIKTGYLPLDVKELSNTLGIALDRKKAYCNSNGLIFGFTELVDKSTGELRYMCGLRGSVHKCANHGAHNANAFRLSDLRRVFDWMQKDYGIKPEITPLLSVEFGVNLKLAYSPQRIIKAVRTYRNYPFAPMGDIGIEYKADAFRFKIYDKGKQCKLHEFKNVLRVEIKAERNQLKKWGVCVTTMDDLLNVDMWKRFEAIILNTIEKTLIVEAMPLDGMTKKESNLFHLFTGDGWRELGKDRRYRERKKFDILARRLNTTDLKGEFKSLIAKECERLRDTDKENRDANGKLFIESSQAKVNIQNKPKHKKESKTATETAKFKAVQKGKNRDANGFKMKGVLVAQTHQANTLLPDGTIQSENGVKKHDTLTNVIKNRGKPPDITQAIRADGLLAIYKSNNNK